MTPANGPRPPRLWALLARLLLLGEDGAFVRTDLDESFARDLERGVPRRTASRRYARNVLASAWSLWTGWMKRRGMRGTLLDARLGLRMLAKQPMLTGVAMLALGLGIPASLTFFHVVDTFKRPLPVPEGDRVMGIRHWDRESRDPVMGSVHDLALWREGLTSFESVGAALSRSLNLRTDDAPDRPVRGAWMSASAFEVLRARALVGRTFDADDELRSAPEVVILSEDLWAARFGQDRDVLGRTVRIGRSSHEVVGVMPSEFGFPNGDQLWLPLRANAADYPVGEGPRLWIFGRLADGVPPERAALEVDLLTQRLAEERPGVYDRYVGEVVSMPLLLIGEDDIDWTDTDVAVPQAILLLFLLIVSGNVATLVLARTATRSGELSIRAALGASRRRIVGQLFVETLVLAVLSTGLGLLVAEGVAVWLMRTLAPFDVLPYWMDVTLRPRTVFVALGVAVLSAVVAGVLPAFKATGRSVQANLQRTTGGRSTMRFGLGSSLLIVSEVVLSVGFLAMGGVMVRSFFQDTEGRLGFDPERYVTAELRVPSLDAADLPESGDEEASGLRVRETQLRTLETLVDHADVVGVGMGRDLPGDLGPRRAVVLEDEMDPADATPSRPASVNHVDPAFFRGLNRPILAGRDFTAEDVEGDADAHRPSVIVNTSFVDQVLEGRNAIGRRFRYRTSGGGSEPAEYEWLEIVGVVGPFGANPINPARDAAVYHPRAPGELNPVGFLVEVADDPLGFVPRFREVVSAVDPEAMVHDAMPLPEFMKAERDLFRWLGIAQVVLAGIAFLLSVSGLYALMSFTVSRRTREIGIRTALGARAWSIVSTVARTAAIQLGVGLALGAGWAWVLLRKIDNDRMLVPIDKPLTIGLTVACAALVGILACAAPTIRGLRVQPTEAFRES